MIKFFHKILLFLFEKFTLCAAKLVKIRAFIGTFEDFNEQDFKSILLAFKTFDFNKPSTPSNAYGFPDSVHTIKKKVRMLWFYVPIKRAIPFKNKEGGSSMQGKQKKGSLNSSKVPINARILTSRILKARMFFSLARILTTLKAHRYAFLGTFLNFNKPFLNKLSLLKFKKVPRKANNLKISGPWLFTSFYFVFMLILPIFCLLNAASKNLFDNFWETATEPVALSAYTVTISMAFFACIFNAFFGFILAWVLVRYNFVGKRLLDAAVDLPFALPTSVAGLTLATVYSDQGWIGSFLSTVGIQIVFTKLGILVAMIFVSFPFVVRTLQPVLQEMEIELEEAAWSLGASPWKTFQKVIFPPLIPAILTGLTLAFSRAIGEYGSIVIVSSNIPLKDLIASVLIFQNLEQYDYTRATVIGTVVLLLSLFLLLGINFLQRWNQKYLKF